MTKQEAVDYLEKLPIDTTIGNANVSTSSNLINMSMDALEKQIPKKPFHIVEHTDYFHWECPTCYMSYGMATVKVRYCPNCGQALKWE